MAASKVNGPSDRAPKVDELDESERQYIVSGVEYIIGLATGVATDSSQGLIHTASVPCLADAMGSEIYSILPLDSAWTQIRLLKLNPGIRDQPLTGDLVCVDDGSLPYKALSYVWGRSEPDSVATITVNGQTLNITKNLFEALCTLRRKSEPVHLWVDAICINQQDVLEKSVQVRKMSFIYSTAEGVSVFLGSDDSGCKLALNFMATAYLSMVHCATHEEAVQITQWMLSVRTDHEELIQSFFNISQLRWWSRAWVVQEVLSSKHAAVCYLGNTLFRLDAAIIDMMAGAFRYFDLQKCCVNLSHMTRRIGSPALLEFYISLTGFRHLRHNTAQSPLDCLLGHQLAYRDTSEPRDRIFVYRSMYDDVAHTVLQPNYETPVWVVYGRATAFMLIFGSLSENWNMLFAVYPLRMDPDAPTWTFDFERPRAPYTLGTLDLVRALPGHGNNKGNTLSSRYPPKISSFGGVLYCEGIDVDAIGLALLTNDSQRDAQFRQVVLAACHIKQAAHFYRDRWVNGFDENKPPSDFRHLIPVPGFCFGASVEEELHLLFPGVGHADAKIRLFQLKYGRCHGSERLWGRWSATLDAIGDLLARPHALASQATPAFLGAFLGDEELIRQIKEFRLNPTPAGDPVPSLLGRYKAVETLLGKVADDKELDLCKFVLLDVIETFQSIRAKGQALEDEDGYFSATMQKGQEKIIESLTEGLRQLDALDDKYGIATGAGALVARHVARELFVLQHWSPNHPTHTCNEQCLPYGRGLDVKRTDHKSRYREVTAIFATRLGLQGITIQPMPDIRASDRLVLLDGFRYPVILRPCGESYTMRGTAAVVGLDHVDLESLVEIGVCTRGTFEIL